MNKSINWIVFEGIDGCGKTTIIKNLISRDLNIKNLYLVTEPFRFLQNPDKDSRLLDIQNKYFREKSILHYILYTLPITSELKKNLFSLDLKLLLQSIKDYYPTLSKDDHLILQDRSYISMFAYQIEQEIESLARQQFSIFSNVYNIRPTIIFYLRIFPEISMDRISKRSKIDKLDNYYINHMTDIFNRYEKIFLNKKGRFLFDIDPMLEQFNTKIITIDSNRSIEEVINDIEKFLCTL